LSTWPFSISFHAFKPRASSLSAFLVVISLAWSGYA
jgi:hypothetical protein